MEAEARLKRHCTVEEALRVGRQMEAKHVILTHFSQRYPKVPPLSSPPPTTLTPTTQAVIFAFDFMTLRPDTMDLAAQLTPALRLLYPGEEKEGRADDGDDDIDATEASSEMAMAALSQPGLFAQSDLL